MASDHTLQRPAVKVFVATTVMLTFISFWRAAAIVLSDLASSAYYVGGDAEKVIGKSAPWFVLAVMLFSYAVRALYIESSAMFVRGGVYRVVKSALGGTLAKLSVSALLFDYILTGPISAVSAGQYLAGLITDTMGHLRHPVHWTDPQVNYFAAGFAALVTVYFWFQNIKGIHESSQRAIQIMRITTVMVVMLIMWCLLTYYSIRRHLPPVPSAAHVAHGPRISGMAVTIRWAAKLTLVLLLVGFGHSVLAMSGEESLAQVNREIESPKLKNLEKTGLVIFIYSLLFTSLVSFFAVMIIPDKVRPDYFANLISGLAMNVVGPYSAELVFQGFRSTRGRADFVGSGEHCHRGRQRSPESPSRRRCPYLSGSGCPTRYGTAFRVLNLIAGLQAAHHSGQPRRRLSAGLACTPSASSGASRSCRLQCWCFVTSCRNRRMEGPRQFQVGKVEIPVGVALISLLLFATAIVNF